MCECDHLIKNKNMYNICIGNTTLPKWKVNKYRENIGLKPLYTNEELKVNTVNSEEVFAYNNIGYGVGTELLHIYRKNDVPPCQDCFKLAKQMNMWGPEKCLENITYIINDILPRALSWIKDNKPWIHKLLPNIIEEIGVKLKIEMDVKNAIANFNTKLNEREKLTRKGGCGCKNG